MLKIAVGSKNSTKINPVKKVFSHYFENIEVEGVEVASGVSEQPLHEDEMFQGALTRAKNALAKIPDAEYGVGIEGGIQKRSFATFEESMVVIVNQKGEVGVGISGAMALPPKVITHINNGQTLSQAIDSVFGVKEVGKSIGAYGVLTKEFVTRSSGMEDAIAFALSRFLHKGLFEN